MLKAHRTLLPGSAGHTIYQLQLPGKPQEHPQSSRNRYSAAPPDQRHCHQNLAGKSTEKLRPAMVSRDRVRRKAMKRKPRWTRTAMCQWKPRQMKTNCFFSVLDIRLPGREGSQEGRKYCESFQTESHDALEYLYALRCEEFLGQLKTETNTHQSEPDYEISLRGEATLSCNMPHSIRCMAWMDEKRWSSRVWMILRSMSSSLG